MNKYFYCIMALTYMNVIAMEMTHNTPKPPIVVLVPDNFTGTLQSSLEKYTLSYEIIKDRFKHIQHSTESAVKMGKIFIDVQIPGALLSDLIYSVNTQLLVEADINAGRVKQENLVKELSDRLNLTVGLEKSRIKVIRLYQGAHALGWEVLKDAIYDALLRNHHYEGHCAFMRRYAIAAGNGLIRQLASSVIAAHNKEELSDDDVPTTSKKRKVCSIVDIENDSLPFMKYGDPNPEVCFIPDDYISRSKNRDACLQDLEIIPYAVARNFRFIAKRLRGVNFTNVCEIEIDLPLKTNEITDIIYALYKKLSIDRDIDHDNLDERYLIHELCQRLYLADKLKEEPIKMIRLYQAAHYLQWPVIKDAIVYTLVFNTDQVTFQTFISQLVNEINTLSVNCYQLEGIIDFFKKLETKELPENKESLILYEEVTDLDVKA